MRTLFDSIDADKGGSIDRDEWMQFFCPDRDSVPPLVRARVRSGLTLTLALTVTLALALTLTLTLTLSLSLPLPLPLTRCRGRACSTRRVSSARRCRAYP